MLDIDLWKRYCSFYEMDFSEQINNNKIRMDRYFQKWKKTDLAKILCKGTPKRFQDIPITTYSDYTMLDEFRQKIGDAIKANPRKQGELFRDYYSHIIQEVGSWLGRYMTEPLYLCTKTTGTTGESKWIAHGETFWRNFSPAAIATAVIACSDGWGETKLKVGDKALNMNAPIPYISGWGALASQTHLKLIPPIEVADNLRDMKEKFNLILKAIRKGEKIVLGGGIGSIFYMICNYFVKPEEFYSEYYRSMDFGLRKILLGFKMLQSKLSRKEKKSIIDYIPLKGILVAGVDAQLYMEFFKNEMNLEPLHVYGSTEAGPLMRGDPDRKTDLVPDLRTSYLEFKTKDGDIKNPDDLKRGETYDLVVTPFGSILFRYDMEDMLRVVDYRDDGMPIFSFEGRKATIIRLYEYDVTPNVIVQALSKAGLRSSEKWAVAKLLKPKEHLHFLMEKTWQYSEREAEKIIFNALLETERSIPHPDDTHVSFRDYVSDFRIKDPSEVIRVEYLRQGAFLRYSILMSKKGVPMGQLKPPEIIPPEKMEIYEILRSA